MLACTETAKTLAAEVDLMTTPIIKTATASDEARAIAVAALAFGTDPAARWTWPDPNQYLRHFPSVVRAFGGKAFAHGSAYCLDGFAGTALWLPPGIQPDEDALIGLLQSTGSAEFQRDGAAVFEQMGRHHPREPHWYLPIIGVDPFHQGKGYGSALMQHALIPCDRDRTLAYLESSNPKNIPLYERHGFELLGTIQVGTSPPIFPMLRKV
jgi:ribosomal protein S18 acetylase RimI-like enzyme